MKSTHKLWITLRHYPYCHCCWFFWAAEWKIWCHRKIDTWSSWVEHNLFFWMHWFSKQVLFIYTLPVTLLRSKIHSYRIHSALYFLFCHFMDIDKKTYFWGILKTNRDLFWQFVLLRKRINLTDLIMKLLPLVYFAPLFEPVCLNKLQ